MVKNTSKKSIKRKGSDNVKVVVRCRPMNGLEKDRKEIAIVTVNKEANSLSLYQSTDDGNWTQDAPRNFTFDHTYGPSTDQIEVFNTCAKPIVNDVLEGFNGTLFAYGQTGTGKTYTMEGNVNDNDLKGIMPRTFEYIFEKVKQAPKNVEYLVRCSFLEIYLNEVYDLLNKKTRKKCK